MAARDSVEKPLKPTTLSDVARLAGVSVATASRALHGGGGRRVKPELSARVLRAADELRYTVNTSARQVVRGKSDMICVIASTVADPYFAAIAEGVVSAAEARGCVASVSVTARDPERELKLVRALRGQRPRAMVLVGSRLLEEDAASPIGVELRDFMATGARVVGLSRNVLGIDSVLVNDAKMTGELARRLVAMGYRKFGVLAGPADFCTSVDRSSGFIDELRRNPDVDDEEVLVLNQDFTWDGGAEGMREIGFDRVQDLDVVWCASDVMVLGAYHVLREWGLRVPEDIALAGFNDIQTLRDVVPAITTVSIPLVELGRRAVEIALAEERLPRGVEFFESRVLIRESTPLLS